MRPFTMHVDDGMIRRMQSLQGRTGDSVASQFRKLASKFSEANRKEQESYLSGARILAMGYLTTSGFMQAS